MVTKKWCLFFFIDSGWGLFEGSEVTAAFETRVYVASSIVIGKDAIVNGQSLTYPISHHSQKQNLKLSET